MLQEMTLLDAMLFAFIAIAIVWAILSLVRKRTTVSELKGLQKYDDR